MMDLTLCTAFIYLPFDCFHICNNEDAAAQYRYKGRTNQLITMLLCHPTEWLANRIEKTESGF